MTAESNVIDPASDPNAAVNELADRFFDGVLERNPVFATILGDDRWDDRLPDLGSDGRAVDAAAFCEVLTKAEAVDPATLEAEQVITRDLLILVARNGLEAQEAKLYQLAINHISGFATLPIMVAHTCGSRESETAWRRCAASEARPRADRRRA